MKGMIFSHQRREKRLLIKCFSEAPRLQGGALLYFEGQSPSKSPKRLLFSLSFTKNILATFIPTYKAGHFGSLRKFLLPMILAFVFILTAAFFSTVAAGKEPLSIKVGAYANHPKIFMDENGRVSGFWPDLMEHIAKAENWNIEYIWGTWSEGLDRLKNKEIDIMPDVAFTEKRNKLYAFSEAPVLMSWTRMYANQENTEIQSIRDLKNKRIAALKGSVNLEGSGGLREIALGFNLNCTFLELDNYTEVFKAIEENRADAGITNRNFGNKNAKHFKVIKTPILFQPINMKFAFPKDAELTPYLAKTINYHTKQLKRDENSIYYRLLEKYFEAEIAEKTVEIFPGWLSAALKTIAALFVFFILVIIATRIQVKRKTREILAGIEALQASEERYRSVFENTGTATVILEEDATISMANVGFEKLSGYTKEEIEGRDKWTDFVVEEDLERMKEYAAERRKNGGRAPTEYEFRFDNKQGSIKDIFLKIGMIPGTRKSVASLMDITERKLAEERITHLNLVLQAIRKVNQLVVTEKDRGRLIQRVCDNLTKTRGYHSAWIVLLDDAGRYVMSAETGLGKDFLPMVEMLKGGEFTPCGRKALSQSGVVAIEDPASTCADCPFVDIHHGEAAMIIRLEYEGKIYGLLFVYIPADFALHEEEQGLFEEVAGDIAFALHGIEMDAEHNLMVEASRQSEEKYRGFFEASKDTVYITSVDGKFLDINDSGLELFDIKRDDLDKIDVARNIYANPADRAAFAEILGREGYVRSYGVNLKKMDGTVFPATITTVAVKDAEGNIAGYQGIIRDETERERLEAQLLQSHKLEAIGQLAGGVAHDFNNILTVIQGYSELLMTKIDDSDPSYSYMRQIHSSGIRAATLTRQLLAFSRKQPMEFRPLDINSTTKDLLKMITRLIGEDIAIHTELGPDIRTIRADVGNIEQVVMNLAVNARDAMPEGGELTIKTENITIDQNYCKVISEARPGQFVCMSIADTGTGMDKEIIPRIFEPFFTTKGLGRGTGLGLSVVYGIIKQHKGWIEAYSEPGLGTTFKIYLPATSGKPEEKTEKAISIQDLQGSGERILVVEDEEGVRELAKKGLGENGYIVFSATNAKEAMDIFEKEKGDFDLIFSDIVLPDKSRLYLVEKILESNPGIHILLSSGYADDKSQWATIRERGFRFLQKPYTIPTLIRAVREVINKDK